LGAEDIEGDAEKPRPRTLLKQLDLAALPPSLQEDDRRQILGESGVGRATEAELQHGRAVTLEEKAERVGLAALGTRQKLSVGRSRVGSNVHAP
jgi:hypothetical protein